MPALSVTCPIDDLPLSPISFSLRGDRTGDARSHLYLIFDEAEVTCANGHAFLVIGNLKLTRGISQRELAAENRRGA